MGSERQEGGSEGRGLGPGAQQAPRCLSGQGKHWPRSFPLLRAPPPLSPPGSPPAPWVGAAGCRNSSPPPAAPQGCWSRRSGLYFCSPFPPSPSLRTRTAGGGLGGQRIRPGISAGSWGPKWAGETWPRSFDPLPSQWFPNFPLQPWDPFPSPSRPSGAPVPSHLHFSSPFTPPTPHVLPGHWGFLPSP